MKSLEQIKRENANYVPRPKVAKKRRPQVVIKVVEKYDDQGTLVSTETTTTPITGPIEIVSLDK